MFRRKKKEDLVEVGAIHLLLCSGKEHIEFDCALHGELIVSGDNIDDLGFGVNAQSIRKDAAMKLRVLANLLDSENDLSHLIEKSL